MNYFLVIKSTLTLELKVENCAQNYSKGGSWSLNKRLNKFLNKSQIYQEENEKVHGDKAFIQTPPAALSDTVSAQRSVSVTDWDNDISVIPSTVVFMEQITHRPIREEAVTTSHQNRQNFIFFKTGA